MSVVGNGTDADKQAAQALLTSGEQLLGIWRLSDETLDKLAEKHVKCNPSAGKIDPCMVGLGLCPLCWPIICCAMNAGKGVRPGLQSQLYILTDQKLHVKVDERLVPAGSQMTGDAMQDWHLYRDSVSMPVASVGDPQASLDSLRNGSTFSMPTPDDLPPQHYVYRGPGTAPNQFLWLLE